MPSPSLGARPIFFPPIRMVAYLIVVLLAALPVRADSWALLIGIDQYADSNRITNLGGAAADARALGKTLRDSAGFPEDHIQLLVSDGDAATRPTRVEILNALTRLASNAKAGDTVFVLYSGHGIEIDGTSYLLPYDTSALSNADIVDSALEVEKFTSRLRKIKARALVLAFDMCRSDPRMGARTVGANTDNKLTKSTVKGLDFSNATAGSAATTSAKAAGASIAITFYSCSPDERSYEDRLQSRGYFSEFLEKGLRGAAADASGTVRVASLAKYLEKNVHTAVAESENGASQTPYPEMKGPGVGDFALSHAGSHKAAAFAGATTAAAAAPATPTATAAPATTTAAPAAAVAPAHETAALPATAPTNEAAPMPPTAHDASSDKVLLRFRARPGQSSRVRGTALFLPAGQTSQVQLNEEDRVTYNRVDVQTGNITLIETTEKSTLITAAGTRNSVTPEMTGMVITPTGRFVAVSTGRGDRASNSGAARFRQSTGLIFALAPVGLGAHWSYNYGPNSSLGIPAAHAEFDVTTVTTVAGVKQFTISMSYSETGTQPLVTQALFVIDPETGDTIDAEAKVRGLPALGTIVAGTIHIHRYEGGPSVR